MRLGALRLVVMAFLRARWRQRRLRSRSAIEAYQARQIAALLRHASRRFAFYRPFADMPLSALPLTDKATLLAHFPDMTRSRMAIEEVRAALDRGDQRVRGRIVGRSTGTSGNRGFYAIAPRERFTWLGTILAKTLPDALWRSHRVALALPAMSELYGSASTGSRITLRFFDLAEGPERWADAMVAFAPDTIVAPPKVLRWLAERGKLTASNIFSGAEVLDPLDRAIIERASGHTVREIYMATEGLFAVSCAEGKLHLAEDVVHFEFEPPEEGSVLQAPIVTDFTRREQALIRYRMNDLLELDPAPCRCGSAFRVVKRIEGRRDDAFLLPGPDAKLHLVTPDILRNALLDADPAIDDFRLVQTGPARIVATLPHALAPATDGRVRAALIRTLARRELEAEVDIERGITADFTRKLRRVRREWKPET